MVPVVAVIGASGSGKTQLIVNIIQLLRTQGYRIGVIKHTHHKADAIELDRPGKDSYDLKAAGADPVLLVGLDHLADRPTIDLRLEELVERYYAHCHLVLVEGFTQSSCPKVVVRRAGVTDKPSVQRAWTRGEVIALVSDSVMPEAPAAAGPVRYFSASEPGELANFLQERFLP